MATILRATNPGHYDRRCDDKCHSATGPVCDCLCGGRYHGAALEDGELGRRIDEFAEEVFANAKLQFPETVDLQRNPQPDEPEKQKTLWDSPVRKPTVWDVPLRRPPRW